MKYRTLATVTALGVAGLLAGCTADQAPEVTPAPSVEETATSAPTESPTPTSTPTPTPEAQRGTRENPLAAGEARRLSEQSAWTISAASTQRESSYVVLPLTVGIDWENLRQQAEDAGEDPEAPTNPVYSLTVKFVAASGKTYDEYPSAEIANDWWALDDVYPPTESVTGNVAIVVPAEEQEGGVWSVENMVGERVFIAQQ